LIAATTFLKRFAHLLPSRTLPTDWSATRLAGTIITFGQVKGLVPAYATVRVVRYQKSF
jgi:hypothetical protein